MGDGAEGDADDEEQETYEREERARGGLARIVHDADAVDFSTGGTKGSWHVGRSVGVMRDAQLRAG
ncbi:MAG: hypothetical protein AMXMBFR20_05100 [Planctomycetia bacterium]